MMASDVTSRSSTRVHERIGALLPVRYGGASLRAIGASVPVLPVSATGFPEYL
jgi:hypothetical protein